MDMAGHFGLNSLLLWAAIITLASSSTDSQRSTHASNLTAANHTISVVPQTSTHSSPNLTTNQNLNPTEKTVATQTAASLMTPMTPVALINSTNNTDATSYATTQPPPPPQCSYTVEPIKFGFRFIISSNQSSDGSYRLMLHEQIIGKIEATNKSFDVLNLKPCTSYTHELSFKLGNGFVPCNHTGNATKTWPLTEEDINVNYLGGHVCYQSKWNIAHSINQTNNTVVHNSSMLCTKYDPTDVCKFFTTNFSTNCGSTFPISKFIHLDPSDITMKRVAGYPVNITTTFPPNCNTSVVNYTCSEKGSQQQEKVLSELEPYTNYTCFANIPFTNVTLKRPNIDVTINCHLTIEENSIRTVITNTSMNLHWNLSSPVCKGLFTRFNFSYNCFCQNAKENFRKCFSENKDAHIKSQEVSCQFSDLQAFENYNCGITVKYRNNSICSNVSTHKTTFGIPEKPSKLNLVFQDHNRIIMTFVKTSRFNGPKKMYIVRLYEGSTHKETKNITKENFTFDNLWYSTKYTVQLTSFNGHYESSQVTHNVFTKYNEPALIKFLVFLIILTSVALILVAYKILVLKRKRSRDSSESMILIPKTNDEDRLIFVDPIASESLLDVYKRKIADEGRLFLAEFQTIPRIFSKYTVKEAKKPHNVPKNRYVDILPYDYNRVQLTTGNGSAGCDYINASFIDGFKESKKYIAAQGPKDETVGDFWRMIWEQQTSIIVMVSRCEEGNRVKCAQYWPSPDRDTEIFDEFIVKLTSEDHYPDYTIRHLRLTNKKDKSSEREVTHIQFMSWPDHGVPEEAHLLLKLRRRVNSFKNFFSGPIVIHCSAGVGRTGTYIGIDAMMESLEAEGSADIYGYVVLLRRQRSLMVQVEAQYILIHQALLEHTQFGETENPLQELHGILNTFRQSGSNDEPTLMEDEFDRLPSFKNWRTFNTGVAEENKMKNRTSSVIPYDYNRVMLKPEVQTPESDPEDNYDMSSSDDDDIEDSANYINASLLSGYWGSNTFIVAQTPLLDTVADFCSMILQNRVSVVVMLSDCSQGDEDCVYWGEDKKTFEDFEVELKSTENSPSFTLRNMSIHHMKTKEHQQVKHFQFLKWGNRELPEKPQDLADLIKEIKHRCGLTWPRSKPIIVHCNDGSSRSGVFCALWNLVDNAEKEKMVDVFQVVKTLRKERQRMFTSLEQYQFLYDALEVIFPVQNGDVKAAQNSVQIVNETATAEQPASITSTNQEEAEESPNGDVSMATEEESSNAPTLVVEV